LELIDSVLTRFLREGGLGSAPNLDGILFWPPSFYGFSLGVAVSKLGS